MTRRAAALALVAALVTAARAAVYLTQDKALALAFPEGTKVERQAIFMTDTQLRKARAAAGGVPVESALVTRYTGKDAAGRVVGTAYFDTHRVRTLDETLMVVVGPDAKVARVEILSFGEPPDYLPKHAWLDQFKGHALDDDLSVKRGIRGITGATLSSQAATDAVRRVLAIHGAVP
ncbi:MAG TPA: FMN-binding protein [Candidatus Polarisedimenticolaceae bacterium]|nr:FMN-binding protein [Candidatus Polarisedimenticolaceae bacterium]